MQYYNQEAEPYTVHIHISNSSHHIIPKVIHHPKFCLNNLTILSNWPPKHASNSIISKCPLMSHNASAQFSVAHMMMM